MNLTRTRKKNLRNQLYNIAKVVKFSNINHAGKKKLVFPTAFKICSFCNSKLKNSPSSIAKQHPSASLPLPLSGLIHNKAPDYH